MNEQSSDARRAKIQQLVKLGIGLIGAVIIAPFVFLAVKGIVGLAIAGALAVAIPQLAPVFGMKVANWKMKLIVGEASKNPIETMLNLYAEKAKELQAADQHIVEFEASISDFDDEAAGFKKKYPDRAQRYIELSNKMKQGLADMKARQSDARKALVSLHDKIEEGQAIYKMSLAAARVTQLSSSAEQQVYQQISEQVAFSSVRTQMNQAFAGLSLALEKSNDSKALLPASETA